MLLSIHWLKDYLLKTDIKIDPKDLAGELTMRGLPVAAIKRPSMGLENVFVGRIEKIEKHPDADRLQVAHVVVSAAADAPLLQIVCGATNICEGDIVAVAPAGALLPGDFPIKVSTIRGVESVGMICSGKELALSEESEGVLQLPKHSTIGQPLSRLLGSDDVLLEFEPIPNRPDCLSMLGIAREVAPLLHTRLREPKPAKFTITAHKTSSIVKVEVDDPAACTRYVARVMDGLKVTDAPSWIKQRLQSIGIRPVNNIVDITNFVMLEYGQPLHAFDLRKIETGTIRVTTCKLASEMMLLNNETITCQAGDILIQDGERPIALAGIMGGANSHIQADTTAILLESAIFDPIQIRRTSKRLGLHTESSRRFEKGVDGLGVMLASERAAGLLRDSFNANVYHPPIDTNSVSPKDRMLAVDMRDIRRITGMEITAEQTADCLESVGISAYKKSISILSVRLPSYRLDLNESVDIIEEVARIAGYDNIPEKKPLSTATYDRWDESRFEYERRAKSYLTQMGLRECIHYSFTSEENLHKYGCLTDNAVTLQNPISEQMKVMRTSLLPSLLETYVYNKNRKIRDQRLFELASVYFCDEQEETKVKETPTIAGLLSGARGNSGWRGKEPAVDFFLAKGIVETIVRQLTSVFLAYELNRNHRLLHPLRSAIMKLGLKEVGVIGEVHPLIRSQLLETTEPIVVFELNLEALRKYERRQVRFKTPSKFPSVELDIAVLIDKSAPIQHLIETINLLGGHLLNSVAVFDVYEGKHLPESKKSIAFHLNFCCPDRTLLEDEVVQLKDKIVQGLSEKHQATLRT